MSKTSERFKAIARNLASTLEKDGPQTLLRHVAATIKTLSRYSAKNAVLILSQFPEATELNGYKKWRERGYQVRKGAKAIFIWAPRYGKKKNTEDDDDSPVFKGFKLVPVFDITQTNAPAEAIANASYAVKAPLDLDYSCIAEAIASRVATVVTTNSIHHHGYYDPANNTIHVYANLPEPVRIHTLLHEAAHALLHRSDRTKEKDVSAIEIEAETAAYVASTMLGLDSSLATSAYLTSYKAKPEDLYDVISRVSEAAKRLYEIASVGAELQKAA